MPLSREGNRATLRRSPISSGRQFPMSACGVFVAPEHQPPLASPAALCPYPLSTQSWISTDLTAPPSWTFPVTERRRQRASLLTPWQCCRSRVPQMALSPSGLAHMDCLTHRARKAQRCLRSQLLSGRAKTRTQASCPHSVCSHWPGERGRGISKPENRIQPRGSAGL